MSPFIESWHGKKEETNMKAQFYRCEGCGNFVMFLAPKTACTPKCCGEPMKELVPNTTEAATEKHIPDVTLVGSTVVVKVGSVTHPMTDEHYIQFVCVETESGIQVHYFKPGDAPEATFTLGENEKPVAVYAYCNLHGLWANDLAGKSTGNDKLVAYFATGEGMEKLAAEVAKTAGADALEILPKDPYTADDLDWTEANARCNTEMSEDVRPALAGPVDVSGYKTVFLGFPIWWNKAPKIVHTFLESASFEGKTIVPFCISGGSKADGVDEEFKTSAPAGATVKPAKLLNGRPTEEEIAAWIKSVI